MLKLTSNNLFISWDFFLLQTASYFFRFALRKECIIKQIFASTSLPLNEIPRVSFAPQNVFK